MLFTCVVGKNIQKGLASGNGSRRCFVGGIAGGRGAGRTESVCGGRGDFFGKCCRVSETGVCGST